jgi:hypothetical protein
VSGYEHELGDGNTWLCPTIRRAIVFPAVPCSYRRMNGVLQRQPLAKYAGIFERAQRWAAQYLGGDGVPPEEQWEASIECLRVNYRLGDEEASLLDVLTDRTMPLVLDAALDVPWLNEALSGSDPEKKSLLDWLHSELGTSEVGDTG